MTYSIAIIGLGLIGSSLACDLSQWSKISITGYDIDEETKQWCLQKGMIDRIAESPQLAAKGSDLIFIATPVRVIPKFIQISILICYLRRWFSIWGALGNGFLIT